MRDRPETAVPGRVGPRVLRMLALLAPALGAATARLPLPYPAPRGFWQGLVVQLFLLLAPLEMAVARRPWSSVGLRATGARRSLAVGAAYSLAYLALLLGAAELGVHTSHFDAARRSLGLPAVLALYLPFWGVLEGVWIAYLLHAWRDGDGRPGGRALALGAVWFGVLHAAVRWLLYRTPPAAAAGYLAVGAVFAIAASITLWTGNAWGTVLFWVVSNF